MRYVDNFNNTAINRKAKSTTINTKPGTWTHTSHVLVNNSHFWELSIYFMAKSKLVLEIRKVIFSPIKLFKLLIWIFFLPINSQTDVIRFSLWLFRYACAFLTFLIGLGAPGVPKRRYSLVIPAQRVSVTRAPQLIYYF